MYRLLFLRFLRSRAVMTSMVLMLLLGGLGIAIGHQYLARERAAIAQVEAHQQHHIARHVDLHTDDLGLLLYYVKFAHINSPSPLAALAIGQSDVNPNVQRITIKNLEGQKYDADLVNPMNLLSGNLDLSFVLIYLFPLLVIVFTFNLLSEETETGTWRLVSIQTTSKLRYLWAKLSVRMVLIYTLLIVLLGVASIALGIPFDTDFILMTLLSMLYIAFWFALCFLVITLRQRSGVNALVLLAIWLVLLVLFPAAMNAYLSNTYPVPEALSTMISQRDGYHTKWDTDKEETIRKFYAHYPQFKEHGYPTEGFNWLWYYAMQQMGDDESIDDTKALRQKLRQREKASKQWSRFLPNMHLQLAFNELAGTSLDDHLRFMDATGRLHEQLRLFFYPKIFEEVTADKIDWAQFTPEYHNPASVGNKGIRLGWPLITATLVLILACGIFGRRVV